MNVRPMPTPQPPAAAPKLLRDRDIAETMRETILQATRMAGRHPAYPPRKK